MLSIVFNQCQPQLNAMILHSLSKEQDREFRLINFYSSGSEKDKLVDK